MPLTLQQTAVAMSGAVQFLGNLGTKNENSTRASVSMTELGSSAGQVFNHLSDQAFQERQDVTRTAILTDEAHKAAIADVKTTKAGVKGADGKKAKASAEMELAKAEAHLTVAKATAEAAKAHASTCTPVNELEDKAAAVQAQAELARDKADELRATGNDHIAEAEEAAADAVVEAKDVYDQTMTKIEAEVKSALGV